jgi:hypothetical protein
LQARQSLSAQSSATARAPTPEWYDAAHRELALKRIMLLLMLTAERV